MKENSMRRGGISIKTIYVDVVELVWNKTVCDVANI